MKNKRKYTLEYREYGHYYSIILEATDILDAEAQAKIYCVENMITFAWVLTKSGKCLMI